MLIGIESRRRDCNSLLGPSECDHPLYSIAILRIGCRAEQGLSSVFVSASNGLPSNLIGYGFCKPLDLAVIVESPTRFVPNNPPPERGAVTNPSLPELHQTARVREVRLTRG